jgi:hypothetical protein
MKKRILWLRRKTYGHHQIIVIQGYLYETVLPASQLPALTAELSDRKVLQIATNPEKDGKSLD